jgi:hypothetical protein
MKKIEKNEIVLRIHDSEWSYFPSFSESVYTEIRFHTPDWISVEQASHLAHKAADIFRRHRLGRVKLSQEFRLAFETRDLGVWELINKASLKNTFDPLFQWFPFTRTINNKKVVEFVICPKDLNFVKEQVKKLETQEILFSCHYNPFHQENGHQEHDHQLLDFQDPFTILATLAFQKKEQEFTVKVEQKPRSKIVYANGKLHLQCIENEREGALEENRETLLVYREFLIKEYGREFFEYGEQVYGLSFAKMHAEGQPCVPDLVFKMNMASLTIKQSSIDFLYRKIQRYLQNGALLSDLFSGREKRALVRNLATTTEEELKKALAALFPIHDCTLSVKKLPEKTYNFLVELLIPDQDALLRACTGRSITHRAIRGWSEEKGHMREKPTEDIFDLIHLYAKLASSSWQTYFELIAHIVAKKHLFTTEHQDGVWNILPGLLIPAPSSKGVKRWYYSESLISDNAGNFHYVLLPACDHYLAEKKPLPMIKLYRSTVSERNKLDWFGSLKADFNPFSAPGPASPEKTLPYEKQDFEKRTIPLWVAYLLTASISHGKKREELLSFAFELCHQKEKRMRDEDLFTFLHRLAKESKELPEYKINGDIAFVGHSLGGTLSEYYLATWQERVPCPGCSFLCYSANAPAIPSQLDQDFMEFGRRHASVFSALGISWSITRQLEYGDIFAQGGGSHLGTTGHVPEDESWLKQKNYVFIPQEDAEALCITTLPTHGRRIGEAEEGKDYIIVPLTPSELYQFDHALWLTKDLRATFGYRVLQSPVLTECFRRFVGLCMQPFFLVYEKTQQEEHKISNRDKEGVIVSRYTQK